MSRTIVAKYTLNIFRNVRHTNLCIYCCFLTRFDSKSESFCMFYGFSALKGYNETSYKYISQNVYVFWKAPHNNVGLIFVFQKIQTLYEQSKSARAKVSHLELDHLDQFHLFFIIYFFLNYFWVNYIIVTFIGMSI